MIYLGIQYNICSVVQLNMAKTLNPKALIQNALYPAK